MFYKKNCQRCGKKAGKKDNFCSNCGLPLKRESNRKDFGILGESDSFNEADIFSNSLMGGIGGGFMNKMISQTMKMIEKEMEKANSISDKNNLPKTKIKLMINGKEINLEDGTQKQPGSKKEKQPDMKLKHFSNEQIKKFSKLTKKEPKTELKRISDKLIYEVKIPGVESPENISITPLENSIELKALGNEKAYYKLIPLNIPIVGYEFSKGLLILEFKGN